MGVPLAQPIDPAVGARSKQANQNSPLGLGKCNWQKKSACPPCLNMKTHEGSSSWQPSCTMWTEEEKVAVSSQATRGQGSRANPDSPAPSPGAPGPATAPFWACGVPSSLCVQFFFGLNELQWDFCSLHPKELQRI